MTERLMFDRKSWNHELEHKLISSGTHAMRIINQLTSDAERGAVQRSGNASADIRQRL